MRSLRLFCLLIFLLAGCGSAATGSNQNNAAGNNAAVANPTPVSTAQTVTIDSPDGVRLVGSLFEAAKPNSPALLLLHQWQSDRHSYDDFAKRMQANGFAVLSIDGRGFGESTKKADGSTVSAGRTDADVKAMLGDVGAAFDFLGKQKNVDPAKIGIVGASYGSSLAIIYAADNAKVAAVALLSPGVNYFGNMQILPAVKQYGSGMERPFFFVAADEDPESASAVKELMNHMPNDGHWATVYDLKSGGHGTALFALGVDQELAKFFSKYLQN